jgi:carbamoyl-phosphate synthase small subunit
MEDRKIVLQDGREFYGTGFGCGADVTAELIFNTCMAGYQEILSDPSYTDQAVVMTYPLIGNYGMADDDYESKMPTIGALIVHEYNDNPSNFRSTKTLSSVMKQFKIPGISGVDTRELTRIIRDQGSRKILITNAETDLSSALDILSKTEIPHNAVSRVSTKTAWVSRAQNEKRRVVLIDCGVKKSIITNLNMRGCTVTVVPWNTSAEKILSLNPDGIMLSNGPGDPTDVPEVIATVKSMRGKIPMFGICLGNQIIALSYGAKTYKMKFGHHGGNHPVKNLLTGKIEITSQNHSYAVDENSLEGTGLSVTHRNILDGTVEGIADLENKIFSVQYHPESMPGPEDSARLFDSFVDLMEDGRK